MSFAVLSILSVMFYFMFHLESVFLAVVGVFLIILSFPLTAIVYTGILRIEFFTTLHTLIIFIVLGIAADDIFVFIDAWR
jgi:hypothetical protein